MEQVLKIPVSDPQTVAEAAALLRNGELCAFPTETVYGLGADATNTDAVLSIYETKGRPSFNPLIIHCADLEMAQTIAEFSPLALSVAQLWPGPLTLVLPLRPEAGISDLATAGLKTVGIRVPDHPLAIELIAAVGKPLAGPSANPSGRLSPTSAYQVRLGFANRVPVLDGGPCQSGIESTIIKVVDNQLWQLRAGALPREDIELALGETVLVADHDAEISAPGMLASHYAPRALLRLYADAPIAGEAFLGFGPKQDFETAAMVRNLSVTGDLREAARNLFSMLQELDASGAKVISVATVPEDGLGEAINDRLQRAAAPRP